ncbi:MAG: hypothetical protein U9R50_00915 [Campylobacterota bacterium]|nr:hypothetical protein [Campylobacterota bacterium]
MYKNLSLIALLTLSLNSFADQEIPKRALKTNNQEVYNKLPGEAENFSEMFSEGEFYGRIRSNNFYFRWDNEDAKHSVHLVSALGASFVYKSATYADFDFSTALYASQAFFDDKNSPIAHLKPGKDVLSRYDYSNTGNKSMATFAQAYLRYRGIADSEIILGRQIVETFYTKSNDTKMIPNTFDGIVLGTKALDKTSIKLAYLAEQKLRDHTQAHSVLMYGDSNASSSNKPNWSNNDDAAMHRGLTYTALKAAGKPTDAPLIVADASSKAFANHKLNASFYMVPELLSQMMLEANYKFNFDGFSLSPGFRYIKQFDNGAGEVGGASYTGNSTGYKNPESLDSQMIAARLVSKIQNYKINLGYSNILDEADLITPWRGFPTAGYTRSMGRYNWRANTQSYRLEMQRNANKKGIYKDLFIQASILYTDADEEKIGYHSLDEVFYYLGFVQNVPSLVNLQWRLRLGYATYLDSDDSDFNNLDARFELNYLF